ncbi:MAG: hypothetical protein LBF58_09405 [Deltaproteobacteria bacterium]|jgi:predicted Fe-Mo cluster-binding NifX family protein|nr:hypothetical protein [Deltaproteobacteria bacterium]
MGKTDQSQMARPRPAGLARGPYRPERLAVASETGENVDACFGRVESFRIYRLVNEDQGYRYEFLETRPAPRPCQDKTHDLAILSKTADLLGDCGMVLAGRIGPAATKALSERGVLGLAVHIPLADALKKLASR